MPPVMQEATQNGADAGLWEGTVWALHARRVPMD
jgi:hypothetical protein